MPQKAGIEAILREPLAGPGGAPSADQLARFLKGGFETWDSDNCCKQSAWIRSNPTTVVATDDLAAAAPTWEPRQGILMTYRRDAKTIMAVAHFVPQSPEVGDRLSGVWAECRVDSSAYAAYEPYCRAVLAQLRFTKSPPTCNATHKSMQEAGQYFDNIPAGPPR